MEHRCQFWRESARLQDQCGSDTTKTLTPSSPPSTAEATAEDLGQSLESTLSAYTLHGSDGTVNTASETELAVSLKCRAPGSIENSSTTIALSPLTGNQEEMYGLESPILQMPCKDAKLRPLPTHCGETRAERAKATKPTMSVRRLTPTECETLQGFPSGWTVPDIEL